MGHHLLKFDQDHAGTAAMMEDIRVLVDVTEKAFDAEIAEGSDIQGELRKEFPDLPPWMVETVGNLLSDRNAMECFCPGDCDVLFRAVTVPHNALFWAAPLISAAMREHDHTRPAIGAPHIDDDENGYFISPFCVVGPRGWEEIRGSEVADDPFGAFARAFESVSPGSAALALEVLKNAEEHADGPKPY